MIQNRRIFGIIVNFNDNEYCVKEQKNLLFHPLVSYSIYAAKKSLYIDDTLIYAINQNSKDCIGYGIIPDNCLNLNLNNLSDRFDYIQSVINYIYITFIDSLSPSDILIFLNPNFPLKSSIDIDDAIVKVVSELDKIDNFSESKKILNEKNNFVFLPTSECIIEKNPFFILTSNTVLNLTKLNIKQVSVLKQFSLLNVMDEYDCLLAKLLVENGYIENYPGRIYFKKSEETTIFRDLKLPYLLITCNLEFFREKAFNYLTEFNVVYYPDPSLEKTLELFKIANFTYWIPSPCPMYIINNELLKNCNSITTISTPSTGSTHIDSLALQENYNIRTLKGNSKLNTITASSEWSFYLIMRALRKGNMVEKSIKSGYWRENEDLMRGDQLSGKNIGIIGFGRIGSNLARYANAFLMNIFAYDIEDNINYPDYVNVMNSIDEVAAVADVFCICIHYNSSTKKIINRQVLDKLKSGVIFVNTSRGEIVDEDVILEKIQNGSISTAAIDVIDDESDYFYSDLYKKRNELNNLILSPHVAGLSNESEFIAFCLAIENLNN